MKLELNYSSADAPTIRRFFESEKRIRGIMGPFGSGKTSACVMEIVRKGCAQRPGVDNIRRTRWPVVRNTYGELEDTTMRTVFDWLPPESWGDWNKSEHRFDIRIPGGKGQPSAHIELLFRALDNPKHVRKLLSAEYTGAYVNEAREVPWTVIEHLDGRIGRFPASKDGGCTWSGIIMDTNPADTDSRFYEYFEELQPPNAEIFKQPSGRGPRAENLMFLQGSPNSRPEFAGDPAVMRALIKALEDGNATPAQLAQYQALRDYGAGYYTNLAIGKRQDYILVYVDGEYGYVQDGKPIYPEYSDNVHCSASANVVPKLKIRRGWDFGLTPACIFSQLHATGRYIVFDEICATRMGFSGFSDEVLRHCAQEYPNFEFIDHGDPAGQQDGQTDEKDCFEIARGKGINMQPAVQTLALRHDSVRKPLMSLVDGHPAFLLHPRCKKLRKGFQGKYRLRRLQISGERYSDEPEKNEYSHPHDALQYDAVMLFGQALKGQQDANKLAPIKYPSIGIR